MKEEQLIVHSYSNNQSNPFYFSCCNCTSLQCCFPGVDHPLQTVDGPWPGGCPGKWKIGQGTSLVLERCHHARVVIFFFLPAHSLLTPSPIPPTIHSLDPRTSPTRLFFILLSCWCQKAVRLCCVACFSYASLLVFFPPVFNAAKGEVRAAAQDHRRLLEPIFPSIPTTQP